MKTLKTGGAVKLGRLFLRALVVLLALCALYTLGMTLAYLPSNDHLQGYYGFSMAMIETEGEAPGGFGPGIRPALLDFRTDRLMLESAMKDEGQNALYNALSVNNYARYWHGYMVFLRPMLCFLTYHQIRYVNVFFILGLLVLCFALLRQRLGRLYGWAFLLAMGMIYVNVFPLSLQFTSAYACMALAVVFRILLDKYDPSKETVLLFFLVVGSFTAFWDLLTVPLLSLGIPLVVSLALRQKRRPESGLRRLGHIAAGSAFWGLGYGLTYLVKWVLAGLVTGDDTLVDAINTVLFRVGGDAETPVNLLEMLKDNYGTMFKWKMVVALAALLAVGLALACVFRRGKAFVLAQLPLLGIAAFPYAWYLVLANHSQMHSFFTYRLQAITVFVVFVFVFSLIDTGKLRAWLNRPARWVRGRLAKL